ncbi:MAG TPA: hypothetical protein VFU23_00475 [Gemmatimonadales bacterium]|nr:hypothetical protein [Gemmatimonadales bacterium]
MNASPRPPWIPAALLAGVLYSVIGRAFAVPTAHAHAWRLAAWAVSGILFAAHIGFEHYRLRNPARVVALHAATAVAIGAGALAAAGMFQSLSGGSALRPTWLLALVLWPAFTAIPAFIAALLVASVLGRTPRRAGPE